MKFASLGSGSRGNATLVQHEDCLLLVDCGFSTRETEARLARLDIRAEQISAILITHEHRDHCSGVARLSRKYRIPVYLTRGTHSSGRFKGAAACEYFRSDEPFDIGPLRVEPLAVPHDALEPCQFVIAAASQRLGILTDIGSITPAVVAHYQSCQGLLLECNYDWQMLQEGPYPASLKRRVGGDRGHLSNAQAAALLAQLDHHCLQHLVVAHISAKNNRRDCAEAALSEVYGAMQRVTWADQDRGFDWLTLTHPGSAPAPANPVAQ